MAITMSSPRPETASPAPFAHKVMSPAVVSFLEELDLKFEPERLNLLNRRKVRQTEFDRGILPGFLKETEGIRHSAWKVAPFPED